MDDVVSVARECLGTPFRHQGRIVGQGLDCVGLAVHIAKRLNLPYQDVKGYSRNPLKHLLEKALDAQPCLRAVSDMQFGDLILFGMQTREVPSHVAICTDIGILHCCSLVNKCCEQQMPEQMRDKIAKIYRFENL